MIIKFNKLAEFAGYFVFFFDVDKVYCCSMPDDDFIKKAGWNRDNFGKAYLEIKAESDELMFNL